MLDKELLRQAIIDALEQTLETASNAANVAKETATSKETIAENKYDTFGLEASYLAHGQSKRVLEILDAANGYRTLVFKRFEEDDEIDISALVTLASEDGTSAYFFIGPAAGGLKIHWQQKDIMVITPHTPLGRQLLGKQLDDRIELHLKNKHTIYDIVSID